MSVAAMATFTPGAAWDQHRPFVSSPLSSSPIRASSPQSPLADRSSNILSREIQSSPIRKTTVFDKFSRFASKTPPRLARHRQRKEDTREVRRREFLDNVRRRADERTYQRRDMEGTLLKTSWDRDMRERELQMRMEGDAFFSEADIDDAAELLIQKERAERMYATHGTPFQPMSQISEGDESVMLDAMMQQEERGLAERITAYNELEMQEQQIQEQQQHLVIEQQPASPTFEYDDDDFDAAFVELVTEQAPDDYGMDLS